MDNLNPRKLSLERVRIDHVTKIFSLSTLLNKIQLNRYALLATTALGNGPAGRVDWYRVQLLLDRRDGGNSYFVYSVLWQVCVVKPNERRRQGEEISVGITK